MKKKYEFKGLLKETQDLIDGSESRDTEFKRQLNGISPEYFVAFSNAIGGTILIGVDEKQNEDGIQIGEIVGCQLSDQNRQTLISMATSCRPSIDINIRVENLRSKKPIIRIDIPEGDNKPYCTSSGVYKIRTDGQNVGIDPPLLKAMILEKESDEFIKRFKLAADEISNELNNVKKEIIEQINRVELAANEAIAAAEAAAMAAEEAQNAAYEASDY